jgi:hypothetical protein
VISLVSRHQMLSKPTEGVNILFFSFRCGSIRETTGTYIFYCFMWKE